MLLRMILVVEVEDVGAADDAVNDNGKDIP